MELKSLKVELEPTESLIPYANNANIHTDEQVEQIANSIKEFGFNDPIAVWTNENGESEIIEGHGRVLAAKKLGMDILPVIHLDGLSDEARRAYTHVHNQLTRNSEFDWDMLDEELANLNFDWDMFGFDHEDPTELLEDDDLYTDKVEGVIYEPSDIPVHLSNLADYAKYDELIKDINESDVPEDIKEFLTHAAERHIVFNYQKIADYYSQADDEVKKLMEDSALVIIDYDRAIELGYVKLRNSLNALMEDDID